MTDNLILKQGMVQGAAGGRHRLKAGKEEKACERGMTVTWVPMSQKKVVTTEIVTTLFLAANGYSPAAEGS